MPEKKTKRGLLHILFPSILGMLLCMGSLAGLSWAWFEDRASSNISIIRAGLFDPTITLVENMMNTQEAAAEENSSEEIRLEDPATEETGLNDEAEWAQEEPFEEEPKDENSLLAKGLSLEVPLQENDDENIISEDDSKEMDSGEDHAEQQNENGEIQAAGENVYTLEPDKSYTLKIDNSNPNSVNGYCIITADENTYKLEVESHDIKTLTIQETAMLRIEKHWGQCSESIDITQDIITGQSEVPSQDVPKDEPEEIIDDKELDNKPEPEIPEEADKNEPIPEQNENKETEENEKESIPDAEHEGEDSTALPDSETSHDAIDETNCVNAEQTNETAD